MSFEPVFTWIELGIIVAAVCVIGCIVALIIEYRNMVRARERMKARYRRIKRETRRADQW